MGALACLVIPIDVLHDPQIVVPEGHRFGCHTVSVSDHEHQIAITDQIALLFPILTQRDQPVPILTKASPDTTGTLLTTRCPRFLPG